MIFLYIVEMHPACFVFPMPLPLYGKSYSLNFLYYKFYLFSVGYIFLLMAFFLPYIDVRLFTPKIADKVNSTERR
jgi:hypothetical protein